MKDAWTIVVIVTFVSTPLVVTIAALLLMWWREIKASKTARVELDMPGLLLASATRWMTEERREWGDAMLAELIHVQVPSSRWKFVVGCLRVVLFPPRREGLLMYALAKQTSACGVMAVILPPLGWPFAVIAAAILGIIGGSPYSQDSRWSDPAAAMTIFNAVKILTMLCFLAGLPLGFAGVLRHERWQWLSVMGIISTFFSVGWFFFGMWLSGND
ncbi:MAG: hypothetical protein L0Y58_17720 [Verrucomicrobia subdivision 3 bacterium]|nr:hypothetical protein [Limisphaerales bacterium]